MTTQITITTESEQTTDHGIEPSGSDALDNFLTRSIDIGECEDCAELFGEDCCPEHSR
jgi:hypothetical protein